MQFYTLDRMNSLESSTNRGLWEISPEGIAGAFLNLRGNTPDDQIHPKLLEKLGMQFPKGLSMHGMAYMFSKFPVRMNSDYPKTDYSVDLVNLLGKYRDAEELARGYIIEVFFEFIREKDYPNLPSRFQSYFAFEERQQVVNFNLTHHYRNTLPALWLVESDTCFKADMSLLDIGNSISHFIENAHAYWSGVIIDKRNVECLLPLPIKLAKRLA